MIKSLLRRFAYALLLLCIISLISFWLSKQVPGDEVMDYISIDDRGYSASVNPAQQRRSYQLVAHQRGLDLPNFYFGISSASIPDSVSHILPYGDRDVLKDWIRNSGNGHDAFILYKSLRIGLNATCDNRNELDQQLCFFFNQSLSITDARVIQSMGQQLLDSLSGSQLARDLISPVIIVAEKLQTEQGDAIKGSVIPKFHFHGTANQYHQWMSGLINQKPLTSLVDGRNAWSKIYDALKWTLLLNGFALIISILAGVGIGIWSGAKDGKPLEKGVNWILFALFALPSFWLGTLLIYFLASGEWFSIFPAGGLGSHQSEISILSRFGTLFTHLFLPVTCLALGSLAYVSRQMKQSVKLELTRPYVLALRRQGISEKTILRKHIIRNALFPIITIIGGSIPALLSGSLIVEVIFSIPGMGRLLYNSLLSRDWPVAFPVLMFGALITIVSYTLTDIIYKWVDPRVKVIGR